MSLLFEPNQIYPELWIFLRYYSPWDGAVDVGGQLDGVVNGVLDQGPRAERGSGHKDRALE